MLIGLTIKDFVLVKDLRLDCAAALNVLTGETGAGKSILLGALGLAVGRRAAAGQVRLGAEQAIISAEFKVPPLHGVLEILAAQGLIAEAEDELILRRIVTPDGRSRAFVNEQPVSIGLLRQIGDGLIEIHGQFDTHGLLDSKTHLGLLDDYALLTGRKAALLKHWKQWQKAEKAKAAALENIETARQEEEFLRHAVAHLGEIAVEIGESDGLAAERALLLNRGKIIEGLNEAHQILNSENGAEDSIQKALGALEQAAAYAGDSLAKPLAALDRALAELQDGVAEVTVAATLIEGSEESVEDIENRLFEIKAAARKYGVLDDELPALEDDYAAQLALIGDQSENLRVLDEAAAEKREAYVKAATILSKARLKAAKRLDKAVEIELPPLKLERARFVTEMVVLEEEKWSASGMDGACFMVATNIGRPAAPLSKIASGGELARFMLALKLNLAKTSSVPTLIFDEIDTGIGGATADAIGQRLAVLGCDAQVIVVTHSPQVAARGTRHWRVEKTSDDDETTSRIYVLDEVARAEEIARMLSGAEVTEEARAAALKLIEGV